MTDHQIPEPNQWITGDEEPTQAQEAYLATLAREAGEEPPPHATKAQASEAIDELRERTGRAEQ